MRTVYLWDKPSKQRCEIVKTLEVELPYPEIILWEPYPDCARIFTQSRASEEDYYERDFYHDCTAIAKPNKSQS